MENKMVANLKTGFTLFRWGIDLCYASLIGLIAGLLIRRDNILSICLIAFGFVVAGFIVLAVGRTIVGLESRKLNFMTERKRTDIEEWFVNTMLGIENDAAQANLLNQLSRISTNKIDDSIMAVSNASTISNFMKVGKVFMSSSVLVNRAALLLGAVLSLALTLTR